jgi:hypothetical protein
VHGEYNHALKHGETGVDCGVLERNVYVSALFLFRMNVLMLTSDKAAPLSQINGAYSTAFPLLYSQTVNSYFDIPIEIYKVWKYSEEYDSDTLYINRERSIVMDVDIFRRVDDPASERITGKASEDVIFGQWFQRMIDDCNLKSPSSPIVYKNEGGAYYEWVFYTKPSFFKRRRYIDPDVTLAGNKLKRHDVIIAKRVANELIKYNEY